MQPNRWRTAVVVAAAILGSAAVAGAAVRPEPEAPPAPAVEFGPGAVVSGMVVDLAGNPVGGARVNALWFRKGLGDAVTGPDGRFTLTLAGPWRVAMIRAEGESKVGIVEWRDPNRIGPDPVRIVVAEPRTVVARVVASDGRPVPGAAVEVLSPGSGPIDRGLSDNVGLVQFRLPASAVVDVVAALKDGVGFDYFENHGSWPSTQRGPLPAEITLTLDGASTAMVRAVDSAGQPLGGLRLHPQLIHKAGRLSYFNSTGSDITAATTDARGLARFAWLPSKLDEGIAVEPLPWDFTAAGSAVLRPGADVPATLRLLRNVRLAGKVTNPDGSPAPGVRIHAAGQGKTTTGFGRPEARTGADGSYSVSLPPDQFAMIAVVSPDHAAPPRVGIITRAGQPQTGLDFRLVPGVRFRARVTTETGGPPVPGAEVSIAVRGLPIPEEFTDQNPSAERLEVSTTVQADASGRIDLRLAPGDYTVRGWENLHVDGLGDIDREFHRKPVPAGPQPPKAPGLTGTVVDATGGGARPVPGALVHYYSADGIGVRRGVARTDAEGRFEFEAERTAGGLLAAMDRAGTIAGSLVIPDPPGEVRVSLVTAATATGRVIEEGGRPLAGRTVSLQAEIPRLGRSPGTIGATTMTNPAGQYAFAGLIPGSMCEVSIPHVETMDGSVRIEVKKFRVRGTRPISLPDLEIPRPDGVDPGLPAVPKFTAAEVASLGVMPWLATDPDVTALILAVGREPPTPDLIARVARQIKPQFHWVTDIDGIRQLVADPEFLRKADRVSEAALGRPADVATVVLLACFNDPPRDEPTLKLILQQNMNQRPTFQMKGTVVDAATERPIADALVYNERGTTTTDAPGSFALDADTRRNLWVEVPGYALAEGQAEAGKPVRVPLVREEPVLGVVVQADGQPVAGAVVWVMVNHSLFLPGKPKQDDHYGFPLTARTDERGRFALRGMPPGVDLEWFEVRHPQLRLVRSRARNLKSGAINTLVVEPGCVVSGAVVEGPGRPVTGALVQLRVEGEHEVKHSATTSAEGRYEFADLEPGRYELVIEPTRHVSRIVPVVAASGRPAVNQVVVEPGATLVGKVVDTTGRPLAGVAVGGAVPVDPADQPDLAGGFDRWTTTGTDGTFRLGPLPAGRFRIYAAPPIRPAWVGLTPTPIRRRTS